MIHRVSGTIVAVITLFYGLFAIIKLGSVPSVHARFGIAIFSLVFFLALSGNSANTIS
jgi:hypothetical protein